MKTFLSALLNTTSIAGAALLLSLHSASAGELDDAWTAYQTALGNRDMARKELDTRVDGMIAIDKALKKASADLVAQNETYYAAMDRYHSLLRQLESRYAERLVASSAPDVLSAERRELQRQWDALLPYRKYVDDKFFNELDSNLRRATRAIAKAREDGRTRIARVIDPAIDRLQRLRDQAFREMDGVLEISFDRSLTAKWFDAALAYNAADKAYDEAVETLDNAYLKYIEILHNAPPAILQKVSVTANGQQLYDFAWVRDGYVDDTQASVSYARDKEALENAFPSYERVLRSVVLERAEGNIFRLDLAQRMHALSDDLMQNAEDYRDAVFDKEVALAVAEIALVVTEAALTGGTATAARKASELAEKVIETGGSKSRKILGNTRHMAPSAMGRRLEDALEAPARARLKKLAAEAIEKRKTYVAERIDAEALIRINRNLRRTFKTIEEAERGAPELFYNAYRREVREFLEKQANDLFPDPNPADFLETGDARRWLGERMRREASSAHDIEPGGVAGKIPDMYAAVGRQQDGALEPLVKRTEASEIFQGEALEWAIGAGVDGAAELTRTILEKRGVIQPSRLTSLSWSQGATVSAAFSIVEASAKTIISSHYENEASEAITKFWSVYAQISAIYSVYATALAEDKELYDIEMEMRRGLLRIVTVSRELGLPRHASGERMEALPITDEMKSVNIHLTFSTPLSAAPEVRLGGEAVSATGSGRDWKIVFTPTDRMRGSETQTLSVSVSPDSTPFDSLDTDPKTIARIPLYRAQWEGFEKGADTNHRLRFQPFGPAVLQIQVDGVSKQIEVR